MEHLEPWLRLYGLRDLRQTIAHFIVPPAPSSAWLDSVEELSLGYYCSRCNRGVYKRPISTVLTGPAGSRLEFLCLTCLCSSLDEFFWTFDYILDDKAYLWRR